MIARNITAARIILRSIEVIGLPVVPLRMTGGQVVQRNHGGRGDRVGEEGVLNRADGEMARLAGLLNAEGGGHSDGLTDAEDQGLQTGRSVGHVGDRDVFFAGKESVNLVWNQCGVGNSEGRSGPTASPFDRFWGEGDVAAGIVMVVGVVADGDRGADGFGVS